ncbi:alpha/beta-Hydrolases superfamily protein [Thalictrum thalictroides]|uniref:Alpha/beta-Hydrolases superfamily protein n=1 Tax=Thalictrum thalictroides TaxID=46969 RepID=A0A7J6WVD2_THATH|nr:alpha/beta-Hydrolases superfamily protein [Thalictrum thalictroides]
MSVVCGLECVFCLGCSRWAWKRCTYVGSDDSDTWTLATPDEFEPIPRICRTILAVYEDDLSNPKFLPKGRYKMNPDWVIKRVKYEQTLGKAPPYLIYADHDNQEIILAVRGLNLVKESDYKLLMNNKLGMQMFDGGYVHHGLLESAIWLLNEESETLKKLWIENGSRYKMVFTGHSLGSGVVSLLTVVVVNHRDKLGGIPRSLIRCYALAPARCMSLNLAVKYADVIYSVILQDDFLPRTPTPLQDIFKSVFCLPCLLFLVCLRDTFMPQDRKLKDARRLYAPGRMYHIVERKFCRCGRFPPEVRTAIPVDGRFEHIVLSCNATSDHAILWIEREAQKALEMMKESSDEAVTTAPTIQKLERRQTIEKEHRDAIERAVSLNVPHAVTSEDESATAREAEEESSTAREEQKPSISIEEKKPSTSGEEEPAHNPDNEAFDRKSKVNGGRTNWDHLVEKLFHKNTSGKLRLPQENVTE